MKNRIVQIANMVKENLLTNQRNFLIFVFFFSFLSHIPGIIILEIEDQPSVDGMAYIAIAKNIRDGLGETTSIKEYWFSDWEENRGELISPSVTAPIFPYFLSFLFIFNESLLAIRIVNSFISSASLVILYIFLRKAFNTKVSTLSTILIMFNPLFYLNSVSVNADPMYYLVFLSPFYMLLNTKDKDLNSVALFKVALLSSLVFLVKFLGIFIIISIAFWFFIVKKSPLKSMIYLGFVTIILMPWMVNNFLETGYLFPMLSGRVITYPLVPGESSTVGTFAGMNFFSLLHRLEYLTSDVSGPLLLYLFLPFSIIGFIKNIFSKTNSLLIIYILVTLAYTTLLHYNIRYLLPILPLFLAYGLCEVNFFIKNFDFFTIKSLEIDGRKILSFFILIQIVVGTLNMPLLLASTYISPYYDNNSEKFEWFNDNIDDETVVISNNFRFTNYFTECTTVRLPANVNFSNIDLMFEEYNISFMVIDDLWMKESGYRNNGDLYSLFYINEIGTIVNTELYEIRLIHIEIGEKYTIRFYEVSN